MNNPRFQWNEKHKLLLLKKPHLIGHMVGKNKLISMHSEWMRHLWLPQKHSAVMAHRGSYKTTSLTEIGVIWRWLYQPWKRIALIRETFTTAAQTVNAIHAMIMTEKIQSLFYFMHGSYPKAVINQDGKKTYSFKKSITPENSIDAYGIDSVPTGSHYDEIICDDTVTINDRLSKAKRVKTIENTREIMNNIIDPGKWVRFVGTPWHPEDAWETINEDGSRVIPEPLKYTVHETGILTPEQIEAKKSNETKDRWAANYLLVHRASDDMIFKNPWLGRWDHNGNEIYGQLDPKYKGKDTNSLTFMAHKEDDRDGQSLQGDGFSFPEHVDEKLEWIVRTCDQKRCRKMFMEDNGDKGYVARDLMAKARDLGITLNIETYHESMNKHNKIVTFLKPAWNRICWNNNELGLTPEEIKMRQENLSQILGYTEDEEPDDSADCGASLVREKFHDSSSTSVWDM